MPSRFGILLEAFVVFAIMGTILIAGRTIEHQHRINRGLAIYNEGQTR
jgi:hypothetical protein